MSAHIDYHRFPRGENCMEDGCRARKFYIEDGKKFCQRGHEQAGFTQTQQDEDDWNAQGSKSRKKREEKERVVRILSGREAKELYLQCYQLILWKQCYWLITVKGLPKELETVVRDLWNLRIRILQGSEDENGYGSGTPGFSSSGGDDTDTDDTGKNSWASRTSKTSVKYGTKLPKLIETLALCYLGMLLMRLPTSLGEIYNWAAKEELIYVRANKEVPKEMRSRLPAYFQNALEVRAALRPPAVQNTVLRLVEFYKVHFEMVFPSLNAPLLIFKHVRDLGLPVEIYSAVRRLAALLGVDFKYPLNYKKSHNLLQTPEIQLISLIVVATKLSHPFDEVVRSPENESDPTTVKIDWEKWRQLMVEKPVEGLKRGEEIKVTDAAVLDMSEKEMDDYLDWYQRNWIDDRDQKMAEQILELFPLQDLPPLAVADSSNDQQLERLKHVQNNLVLQISKSVEGDEAGDIKRPGELYKRFGTVDELPESAKAFYEIAAANSGISLQMLVRGVFLTERYLTICDRAERKRRFVEDQHMLPSDS